jgi:hypothetical protein
MNLRTVWALYNHRFSLILRGSTKSRSEPPPRLPLNPNLGQIREFLGMVPGMIDVERCILHMVVCFTQVARGDVIEIGAWQGRNSIALALGCVASGNGRLTVIDHFKGNPGKESYYKILNEDLSDLLDGFNLNVTRAGLTNEVTVFAGNREDFDEKKSVRLLFIDGNHEYEAVKGDIAHFRPMLVPQAVVIFDDYSEEFPGVVRAGDEFIKENPSSTSINLGRSLVVKM